MHIVLVEDDEVIRETTQISLERFGYTVTAFEDGREGYEFVTANGADAILLDLMLPTMNGASITRAIRERSTVPIIVISARSDPIDIVQSLEAGADDYLTKPFELTEVVLRLRALDRRRPPSQLPVHDIAGLRVDPFRREVFRDDRYVALTRKQFAVLEVLVQARGGVISAEELLERAWDANADPFTNAVRITVSALRKRLGEPQLIETVPGVGYRLALPRQAVS